MSEQEKKDLLGELPFLIKIGKQRAGLMALVHNLLTSDGLSHQQIKSIIVKFFSQLIDDDSMVGDEIDVEVCKQLLVSIRSFKDAEEKDEFPFPSPSAN